MHKTYKEYQLNKKRCSLDYSAHFPLGDSIWYPTKKDLLAGISRIPTDTNKLNHMSLEDIGLLYIVVESYDSDYVHHGISVTIPPCDEYVKGYVLRPHTLEGDLKRVVVDKVLQNLLNTITSH